MIVIQSYGSEKIGMGHIFRSIAIAEALREHDTEGIMFLINSHLEATKALLQFGFPYEIVQSGLTGREIAECVSELSGSNGVCVIDSKENHEEEIRWLKGRGIPVLLLDNRTDSRLYADVNIYPGFARYYHRDLIWNGYGGRVLGGGNFVPISKRIKAYRSQVGEFSLRRKILVTMGGADPYRLSMAAIRILCSLGLAGHAQVVVGMSFSHKDELLSLLTELGGGVDVVKNTVDLGRHMATSGLAITALGTTIYELAYLGVPTIIVSNYRDDASDEQDLKASGCFIPLGFFQDLSDDLIGQQITYIWRDSTKREGMSVAGLRAIDGLGAERICAEIFNLQRK